jgi:hypothetical protein
MPEDGQKDRNMQQILKKLITLVGIDGRTYVCMYVCMYDLVRGTLLNNTHLLAKCALNRIQVIKI